MHEGTRNVFNPLAQSSEQTRFINQKCKWCYKVLVGELNLVGFSCQFCQKIYCKNCYQNCNKCNQPVCSLCQKQQ